MRQFTTEIFDDIVVGTGTSWYTSASHNDQLGSADFLTFHAVTTGIGGSTPKLTCQLEHSGDGRSWSNVKSTPELDAVAFSDHGSLLFRPDTHRLLTFVRVRIALTSVSGTPQCRLKLFATGRVQMATQRANGRGTSRSSSMR